MSETKHELFTDAFNADPHRAYAQLRRDHAVFRTVVPGGATVFLVTGYDDARRLLTDSRLSKRMPDAWRQAVPFPVHPALLDNMLLSDPPVHTRLRRLVSAAFTARRIEALYPRIQELTDELLDDMAGKDTVDMIDALAFPLPIQVICELVGIPVKDRDAFRKWSDVLIAGFAAGPALTEAAAAMAAYIEDLVARKRAALTGDLLSGLIEVTDGSDRLSDDELISMVFLLLIAGHETTVNLIGNAVYLLGTRTDQRDRVVNDPSLLPGFVEEVLRLESPVETATFRVALEPIDVGNTVIPAGGNVMISLLAAHRDETQFPDADRIDVTRPGRHLAFGHGIHFCLGAPLARAEARISLERLLRRYPKLTLGTTPDTLKWRPGLMVRGVIDLPIQLRS